jgi:hypothetical protein
MLKRLFIGMLVLLAAVGVALALIVQPAAKRPTQSSSEERLAAPRHGCPGGAGALHVGDKTGEHVALFHTHALVGQHLAAPHRLPGWA